MITVRRDVLFVLVAACFIACKARKSDSEVMEAAKTQGTGALTQIILYKLAPQKSGGGFDRIYREVCRSAEELERKECARSGDADWSLIRTALARSKVAEDQIAKLEAVFSTSGPQGEHTADASDGLVNSATDVVDLVIDSKLSSPTAILANLAKPLKSGIMEKEYMPPLDLEKKVLRSYYTCQMSFTKGWSGSINRRFGWKFAGKEEIAWADVDVQCDETDFWGKSCKSMRIVGTGSLAREINRGTFADCNVVIFPLYRAYVY